MNNLKSMKEIQEKKEKKFIIIEIKDIYNEDKIYMIKYYKKDNHIYINQKIKDKIIYSSYKRISKKDLSNLLNMNIYELIRLDKEMKRIDISIERKEKEYKNKNINNRIENYNNDIKILEEKREEFFINDYQKKLINESIERIKLNYDLSIIYRNKKEEEIKKLEIKLDKINIKFIKMIEERKYIKFSIENEEKIEISNDIKEIKNDLDKEMRNNNLSENIKKIEKDIINENEEELKYSHKKYYNKEEKIIESKNINFINKEYLKELLKNDIINEEELLKMNDEKFLKLYDDFYLDYIINEEDLYKEKKKKLINFIFDDIQKEMINDMIELSKNL